MEKQLVDANTIGYLAGLARISLCEEEEKRLKSDLVLILEYVSQLDMLNTDHVEPTDHVMSMTNVFRDDNREKSIRVDQALANAPDTQRNFFKVPRVI